MKTNNTLQNSLGLQHQAHKVYYAALVLKAALTNSAAVLVREAVPAVAARAGRPDQLARPARAATAAVSAANNTVGYVFGQLYLNSPAYPIGTAIPAIPAKPASQFLPGITEIVAVPAITAVSSPEVQAIKGWEDAIQIIKTQELITIIAELPVINGVGIVGFDYTKIGEITPVTLQANAWLNAPASSVPIVWDEDKSVKTLEEYFYKYLQLSDHTTTDIIRIHDGVSISCKRFEISLYPLPTFNPLSTAPQLGLVEYSSTLGD
jgi:hypothetical protein